MAFSQNKLDEVKAGIARALAAGTLSAWEQRFVLDMQARLDRHGRRTRLSAKQYGLLMRLCQADGADRTGPSMAPASASGPGRPMRSSPRPPQDRSRRSASRPPGRRRGNALLRRMRTAALGVIAVVFAMLLAQTDIDGILSASSDTARAGPGAGGWISVAPARQSDPRIALVARDIQVVDGDTIRVPGDSRRVRLVGFNTPEVFSPRCERERQLGIRATERLREMLKGAARIEFQRVACACPPGTEGTSACNFGRICGSLHVDGRDVGDVLISEGLAARYRCGPYSCPRAPGDWCG
ncbi:thermonuclease family protein [Rhodovulum strictum]|uniref:Thermonuclease family protein n=1 Tax=Rhodovulum strictum TaxID=58314 RepID=A0A844BQ75_9RHOB|nr:thermonuclease family protein [Rhodovulum strictum]MRH22117.1 thermonuclease family protein [Rhodovulum strictum]